MSARVCVFGPLIDHTCGALFCPRGAEGPEDGDWDAYCTQCRAEAEAAADLANDAAWED